MLIEKYSKFFINFNEVYFSKKIINTNADIVKYRQCETKDFRNQELFYTLIIDLNNSEEEIRGNIRRNYIHRINQAVKKHFIEVKYINKPNISELDYFVKRYNKISQEKGYAKIKQENLSRINDNLVISYALYKTNIICGHLYIYDDKRFRQLNSFIENYLDSIPIYKISSTANKFLSYKDIFYARSKKFLIFDFGGIFNLDSRTRGITIFKLGFSKTIEKSYNFITVNTLKGIIFNFIIRYFNFKTIHKLFFILRIYFQEYISKRNLYFCKFEEQSKNYSYFREAYLEFFNIKDIHRFINYKKGDKIYFLGINNAFLFQFLKKFKGKFITIIESNSDKINYLNNELKKLKSNDISLIKGNYLSADLASNFNYIFINNKDLKLEELKCLLKKIIASNNNQRYYVIYLNPIYNYIFKQYNLNLIKDFKSVLSSRVHIYSNI